MNRCENMIENIIIIMRENVRGHCLISKPGTILRRGVCYNAKSNKYGAVSGLCDNGEWLGVKPKEFDFIEAPEWLLKIHNKELIQ